MKRVHCQRAGRDNSISVIRLDSGGHVKGWDITAQVQLGYDEAEANGRHISCFITSKSRHQNWLDQQLESARIQGKLERDAFVQRKNGSIFRARIVIASGVSQSSGDPAPDGFVLIISDPGTSREPVDALQDGERNFLLMLGQVRDYAIFMLDCQGNVVTWNEGATYIKGYQSQEIIGQHFSVFYPPAAQRAEVPARTLESAAKDRSFSEEGWRVRKDGSLFWASVTITAIHDEHGELCGFAKVTRDMTQRKRLEELEIAEHRMSEFLAMLAHELRNPLAPLRSVAGILQGLPDTDPLVSRCGAVAARQVQHLTRLVDDLLDVGRVTAGKIELRTECVSLRQVVGYALEDASPYAEAKSQHVQADFPDEEIFVQGDEARLAQVLQNLLNNASKFSPKGSTIDVRIGLEGRTVVVDVVDHGRGIAPEQLDAVFHLFSQEQRSHNPSESGLGIGLTLSRSLVELHGGSLTVFSDGPEQGCTFSMRLPTLPAATLALRPAPDAHFSADGSGTRVLIVDDNRDGADSLATLIGMKGHEVRVAYHAYDAIGEARSFAPGLLLIDLAMPDMDGFALLDRLKLMPNLHGSRFVALTGYGQQEDRVRTRNAGFDAHLVKPIAFETLDELLGGRSVSAPPLRA